MSKYQDPILTKGLISPKSFLENYCETVYSCLNLHYGYKVSDEDKWDIESDVWENISTRLPWQYALDFISDKYSKINDPFQTGVPTAYTSIALVEKFSAIKRENFQRYKEDIEKETDPISKHDTLFDFGYRNPYELVKDYFLSGAEPGVVINILFDCGLNESGLTYDENPSL